MPKIDHPIVFLRAKRRTTAFDRLAYLCLTFCVLAAVAWLVRWELTDADSLRKVAASLGWGAVIQLVLMVVAVALAVAMQLQLRSARLVLDAVEIRLETPSAIGFMAMLAGHRRMEWKELKNVSQLTGFGAVQLRAAGQWTPPWAIRLNDWRLAEGPAGTQTADAPSGREQPDLLRVFHQLGLFEQYKPSAEAVAMSFDLFAHPATRWVLGGYAAMGIYCVAERLLQEEAWAFFNRAYCVPHVVAGVLAACAVFLVLKFARIARGVPASVAQGLAVLALVLGGVTSYMAGIRVNQLAGGPLVQADYRRSADCANLLPADKRLPVVEYTSLSRAYWCSIPETQTVKVRVRQGLFGLYQLNLSEHTQAIRQYRLSH